MVHSSSGRFALTPARFGALTLIAIALVVAALSGCGGSSKSSGSNDGAASASPTPPPSAASPAASAPSASAPAGTADGAAIFQQRCALCHGPTGHGDGPGGKLLNPHPRNFHDAAYMSTRSDEQLLAVIHQGKGPMPRWGGILTDAQITAVLAYVRQFAKTP